MLVCLRQNIATAATWKSLQYRCSITTRQCSCGTGLLCLAAAEMWEAGMRSIILYAGLRIQKGVQSRQTSSILLFSAQPALHNNNFVSAMIFSMFPTAMSDMFRFFVAQNPFKAVRLKHISRNVIWIWFQTPEECSLVLVFHNLPFQKYMHKNQIWVWTRL